MAIMCMVKGPTFIKFFTLFLSFCSSFLSCVLCFSLSFEIIFSFVCVCWSSCCLFLCFVFIGFLKLELNFSSSYLPPSPFFFLCELLSSHIPS